MIAIILFATLATLTLAMLLARYGPRRATMADTRDLRPSIPREVLREIMVELLQAMGLLLGPQADSALVATQRDALGEIRYVVVVSGDAVVDQQAILAAAETVRALDGARGMLVAAGEIESDGLAGMELPLELVDRARLRQLIAQHLPARLATLEGYRGFGLLSQSWRGSDPLVTR